MRSHVAFVLALLLAALPVRAAEPLDLLLVAADDATLQPVLERLGPLHAETRGAWTLWRGSFAGKSVAVTRTEGDPLNAVAATTLALRHHPPRLVVVFGTSRAHDPALRAGDLVVSEAFCAFDGMVSPILELDQGSDSLQWRKLPHALVTAGEKETPHELFPADARAIAAASALANPRGRVLRGVLGSAPQINREADRIAHLRRLWNTSTEDGESAHVAGCAALFNVPVVGLRVVEGSPHDAATFALGFMEAWK